MTHFDLLVLGPVQSALAILVSDQYHGDDDDDGEDKSDNDDDDDQQRVAKRRAVRRHCSRVVAPIDLDVKHRLIGQLSGEALVVSYHH